MSKDRRSILAPLKTLKYLFKKPVTHDMKDIFDNPREVADNYRGFHINDWDKCIGCGTCSEICPTEAIHMVLRSDVADSEGSKPERPTIDYGRCCFCALCVDICTTASLKMSKHYLFNSSNPDDYYFMPTEKVLDKEVKVGYQKTEASDLLDLNRIEMETIDEDGRKDSFIEIVKGYSREQAMAEASRCVECGICTKTCPAHMNIPEYIKAIWEGDFKEAVEQVYKTNPLPGTCGRICTHNCESVCALTQRGEAISIRWLKRYIVDNAPQDIYEKVVLEPVSQTIDKSIAVIGSGPAGLAAAYYLRTIGYQVDVYEQMPLAGGVLRYGIPKYRLPDESLDKDISFIEKIGVKFHYNSKVGKNITFEEIKKTHEAIFFGTGFFEARNLPIPNNDHQDVILAMDYLKLARDYSRGTVELPNVAPDVVVIGGGNVAFDVARSVVRMQNEKYGKSNVKMTALESREILPADDEEYEEGKEEGIQYFLGNGPQEIVVDEKSGKIKGLKVWKVLSIFDEDKRFNPTYDKTQEQIIEGSQVYVAIGQMPDYQYIPEEISKQMTINRGRVMTLPNGQVQGVDYIFAGGDIVKGPDVINGIATGHQAALAIDEYLSKKK